MFTWVDILFEKLRPKTGGWIWKTFFALLYPTLWGSWPLNLFYQIYRPIQSLFVWKELYDMQHYITFLLITTLLGLGILSKSKFESVFLLGAFFTLLIFFYQSENHNWMRMWLFYNTAIISCLIYSLNIPHRIQSPSFFPVQRSVYISSQNLNFVVISPYCS